MARIACFGEVLLRLSAPQGELLLQSPSLRAGFAGAEANVAASLSRFGHEVKIATALPENGLGDACRDALRGAGIDVSRIIRADGRLGLYYFTSGAMMRVATVLYDRADSAFARVCPDDFDWDEMLADVDWLHLSGLTAAISEGAFQSMLRACEAARRLGTRISFDYNYRRSLWLGREEEAPRMLSRIAREAEILIASPIEAAAMCGAPQTIDFHSAAGVVFDQFPTTKFYAATVREIMSSGDQRYRGMIIQRNGAPVEADARLDGVIDRIGSGDAFAAAILHGAIEGNPTQDIIAFAVGAAALKHSVYGDFNPFGEADIRNSMNQERTDVRR